MDILLSETEQNLLMLLEELAKHQDWIQDSSLSENLNLSAEELQEHLFKLEQLFPNLLLQSKQKRHSIAVLTSKTPWIPGLRFFKQSETYSFLNQLFFNEGQSLEQMCQELVMSCERVQEIIQHLNTKLPQHYGIKIQLSPLVMKGTEEDIRAFYLDYFSQSYSFLDWPFSSISEEALTQLIQLFLNAQQVSPNLSSLRQIKYTLAINLERFRRNTLLKILLLF